MALSEHDLIVGQAARYLLGHAIAGDQTAKRALSTKLLSSEISNLTHIDTTTADILLRCPRDLYEDLWHTHDTMLPVRQLARQGAQSELLRIFGNMGRLGRPRTELLVAAFGYALNCKSVRLAPVYGAPTRTAEEQTELFMYVFGDDPVGQQVQVLDVGKHSAPTRQLLVSPVPVLPVDDIKRDEKLGFVMMPFAAPFRLVYDNAITPAVADAGLTCRRGDDINQPGAILTQVWHAILSARLVIADVSGANGNVLYELGLAHVVGHEAILLTQNIDNVPFDLRHQRVIVYDNTPEGLEALRMALTAAIQTALASSTR